MHLLYFYINICLFYFTWFIWQFELLKAISDHKFPKTQQPIKYMDQPQPQIHLIGCSTPVARWPGRRLWCNKQRQTTYWRSFCMKQWKQNTDCTIENLIFTPNVHLPHCRILSKQEVEILISKTLIFHRNLMCVQGHAPSRYKRFRVPINLQHMIRGTQQPPPSLLHFYAYDSFRANYKANNTAPLHTVQPSATWCGSFPRLLFIGNDTGEMSAKCSAVNLRSSM